MKTATSLNQKFFSLLAKLREFVREKLIKHPPAISHALTRDVNRYINATEDIEGFAASTIEMGDISRDGKPTILISKTIN